MYPAQRVALDALTTALRGEAVAFVEYHDDDGVFVDVGASSERTFTIDPRGKVTER
jgi:hypothetical protein